MFQSHTGHGHPAPGEPSCGQDGQLSGPQPSDINRGDGTVIANVNKLMWVEQLSAKTFLGLEDWRLPNVNRLQNLVDYS